MRIEISSGGIGVSVMDFQSGLESYLSGADSVISCFKTIKHETCSLSGGVSSLQTALDDIDARLKEEETVRENADEAREKANSFLSLAQRVDNQVARNVKQNRDEFYSVNSWAKPSQSTEKKKWYERAWDWLCKAGESIAVGLLTPWIIAYDAAKKLWNSALDYIKKNKLEVINWAVTILCIAGSIAIIALTGGASLLVIALVSAASAAIIAGTRNVTSQYAINGSFENFNWGSFAKDVLVSAVIGGVTGVVGAGISSLATGALSNTALATFMNSPHILSRFLSGAAIGGISHVLSGIATRGVGGLIGSLFGSNSVDFSTIFGSAFNFKNILLDFAIGGALGGIHVVKSPIGKELTLENLEDTNIDSKPAYSRDPQKWLENGGKIYIDGNGTWTYEAPDGVHVCYSDGLPDYNRAGIVYTDYQVQGGFNVSNHSADINEAIRSTGLGGKGSGYTWHHYQDGHTLQLVDTYHHELFRHIGGFSIAKGY